MRELLQVVILQEKLEEKEDEIRRLKQENEVQKNSIVEEQTVLATDDLTNTDEGMPSIEVQTEN